MKLTQWTTLVVLALVLATAGCAPAVTATPIPSIALDSTGPLEVDIVQASAEIVPAQETRLSFVISGPIKEVTVEKGSVVESGQILATLSSPELEYGLLQAEAALRVAEFDYEYWKLPRRLPDRTVVDRRPVAEQELEMTRRSLDTSRAALAQTELVAPFAGTVVSVEVQPGEYVRPGQVVVVLAELNNLKVETTDLSELNVAAVEIGQPASVYVEALDKEFQGVVTAISPISDTIGGDVVFKVTIRLDDQPADLLWGMSADVEIQTEQ
jgi:RND family efflux transporter MFP subunit